MDKNEKSNEILRGGDGQEKNDQIRGSQNQNNEGGEITPEDEEQLTREKRQEEAEQADRSELEDSE